MPKKVKKNYVNNVDNGIYTDFDDDVWIVLDERTIFFGYDSRYGKINFAKPPRETKRGSNFNFNSKEPRMMRELTDKEYKFYNENY